MPLQKLKVMIDVSEW